MQSTLGRWRLGRWKILIAAVAALGALSFMASPPAHASTLPYSLWDNSGPNTTVTFSLHASAHNSPLTTCRRGCTAQAWDFINCENHTFWDGVVFGTCDIHLEGTSECVNYIPSSGFFYLDSCVANDANEEFAAQYEGPPCNLDAFANFEASDLNHPMTWLTAYDLAEGAFVHGQTGVPFYNPDQLWGYNAGCPVAV